MKLEALTRFKDSTDDFKLTKLSSKRPNSMVDVGQFVTGEFSLVEFPATDTLPEETGVHVGRGFSRGIRTSPVVGIVDQSENATTFETQGGVYRLEKV
jgi:hypothetical protein